MPKKIIIPEKDLRKYYCEEGLGSKKIAKIFGCSPTKILDSIKEYKIEPHQQGEQNPRKDITKEVLQKKYKKEKKGIAEISNELNCSASTIRNKLLKFRIKIRPIQESNSSPEAIEKRKKTNLKNWGVGTPAQSREVMAKIHHTNSRKYGHKNPMQNRKIAQKSNENRISSLVSSGGVRMLNGERVSEIAKRLKIENSWAHQLINKNGIEFLKDYEKNSNSIEAKMKKFLTNELLLREDEDFIYNKGLPENKRIGRPDFCFPNLKLIIECDGDYWHGNPKFYKDNDLIVCSKKKKILAKDKWKADEQKNKLYESYGYNVLRIWEYDINKNWRSIKPTISNLIATRLHHQTKNHKE